MITIPLSTEDLTKVRLAPSPLWETVTSFGVLLSQGPGIVLIGAALLFTRWRVPIIRTIVDAQQEQVAKERAVRISGLPA